MGDRTPGERSWLRGNVIGIAGWLFADLLIGLLVIFIASTPTFVTTESRPTPSPSISPTPTAPPMSCTTTVAKNELQARSAPGPGGTTPTHDQLAAAFAPYRGKPAGIVLTTVTDTDIDSAQKDAAKVNVVLAQAVPDVVTASTIVKALGYQDRTGTDRGAAEFDFYLLVTTCVVATPAPAPSSG